MRRIEKKIWPASLQAIEDGKKKFDLRLADFEVEPGDTLVLKEWDPKTKEYTGRSLEKRVTYVGKTKGQSYWPQEEVDRYGFQILSLE